MQSHLWGSSKDLAMQDMVQMRKQVIRSSKVCWEIFVPDNYIVNIMLYRFYSVYNWQVLARYHEMQMVQNDKSNSILWPVPVG